MKKNESYRISFAFLPKDYKRRRFVDAAPMRQITSQKAGEKNDTIKVGPRKMKLIYCEIKENLHSTLTAKRLCRYDTRINLC